MAATKLIPWLERLRSRERKLLRLEDVLIGGRYFPYAMYRLRFYGLSQGVILALHIVEYLFLSRIFSNRSLVSVLFVQNGFALFGSFWWGGLESLRGQVRAAIGERDKARAARVIGAWILLAGVVAAGINLSVWAWVLREVRLKQAIFSVFHLFWIAVAWRSGLELVSKTVHSSVFAVRRVYRPMAVLLATEGAAFGLALVLWPHLRYWSFSISILVASTLTFAIGMVFNIQAIGGLHLPRIPLSLKNAMTFRPSFKEVRQFLLSGLSFATQRLGSLLVMAMAGAGLASEGSRSVLVSFYLVTPVIGAVATWTQLFYFDLKKMESELQQVFLREFQAFSARLAWWIGTVGWAVAINVIVGINHRIDTSLALVLLPFLVLRSRMSVQQLWAYTQNRHIELILSSVLLFAGMGLNDWVLRHWGGAAGLAVLGGCLLAIQLWLNRRHRIGSVSDERFLISPYEWLRWTLQLQSPVSVGRIRLATSTLGLNQTTLQILKQKLKGPARACMPHRGELLWIAPSLEGAAQELKTSLLVGLAGLLEEFELGGAESGKAAFEKHEWLLHSFLPEGELQALAPPDSTELSSRFRELFPEGWIFRPKGRLPQGVRDLSSEERAEIWKKALRAGSLLPTEGRKSRFDVTAFCRKGMIETVFIVERSADPRARGLWKTDLRVANLAGLLASSRATTTPERK